MSTLRSMHKSEDLNDIFARMWQLALPYQDQRDDPGHAEVTLDYAMRLLESQMENPDSVIPTIILHDVGWSQLPRERRLIVFDKSRTHCEQREVQFEHQDAGVKLAKEILDPVEYPSALVGEILEIVSEHDTRRARRGFISRNEGLTRDADGTRRACRQAKGYS